eukprot:365506-Chlamydomonas_euryale.AAC.10
MAEPDGRRRKRSLPEKSCELTDAAAFGPCHVRGVHARGQQQCSCQEHVCDVKRGSQASQPARQQASKQVGKQAGRQAGRQASRQASKLAGRQASTKAGKQAEAGS